MGILEQLEKPKTHRLFLSTIMSCQYVFGIYVDPATGKEDKSINGATACFKQGMYVTDDPLRIKMLEAEIASKPPHPHIKNPSKQEDYFVPENYDDPIKRAENKARSEVLKELLALGVISKDLGQSVELGPIKAATTAEVAKGMIESTSGSPPTMAQRLAALNIAGKST